MRKTITSFAVAAVFGLFGFGQAAAQACFANLASNGQGFVQARTGFTEGAWSLGGSAGGNLHGPVSLSAGFSHLMFDNSDAAMSSVGAGAGIELSGMNFSLCPAATISYEWLSSEGELAGLDLDGVVFGGGLAFGKSLRAGDALSIVPHASATVMHSRASASFAGVSGTGSETFGAFDGGLLIGGSSVYFGPSVSITTLEGSDPVFGVALGLVL